MKKAILIIVALTAALVADAQECLKLKKAQHFKMTSYRYANDEVFMPAWAKMKEEKKDEKVAMFNAGVSSGATKSSGGGTYVYEIKNMKAESGSERALFSTMINGKEYQAIVACIHDTMYFTRIVGPNYSILNGDTLGIGILGVQAIPNNLKVGDELPPYEDIGLMVPDVKDYTAKHKALADIVTSTSSFRDIGFDSNTGQFGEGTRTVTKTEYIYKEIPVQVRETIRLSAQTINYAMAKVVGEEEITIDGIRYKAFKIESESWIKGTIDKSYEASNSDWKKARLLWDAKVTDAMLKRGVRKGYTNAQGYVVSYRTEWFIPGIGVAKMDIYDNYGNILAHSVLESLQ